MIHYLVHDMVLYPERLAGISMPPRIVHVMIYQVATLNLPWWHVPGAHMAFGCGGAIWSAQIEHADFDVSKFDMI